MCSVITYSCIFAKVRLFWNFFVVVNMTLPKLQVYMLSLTKSHDFYHGTRFKIQISNISILFKLSMYEQFPWYIIPRGPLQLLCSILNCPFASD